MYMGTVGRVVLLIIVLAILSPVLRYSYKATFWAIGAILIGVTALWALFAMGGFAALLAMI